MKNKIKVIICLLTKKMLYIKKILEEESDKSGTIFTNGDISSGFKPYFRQE